MVETEEASVKLVKVGAIAGPGDQPVDLSVPEPAVRAGAQVPLAGVNGPRPCPRASAAEDGSVDHRRRAAARRFPERQPAQRDVPGSSR
jgi:hypothetical protein